MTMRRHHSLAFVLAIVLTPAVQALAQAPPQPRTFAIDPAASTVEFTLGDVLHTVHGTFKVKSGSIRFDDASGTASGTIVVDAASGDSGSKSRDKKMRHDILETDKFPDITLTAGRIKGAIAREGMSQVELEGSLTLHGQDHPMTFTVPVTISQGAATADVSFVVPYVKWGLKNPSTFILRVSDKVEIKVHAVGSLTSRAP